MWTQPLEGKLKKNVEGQKKKLKPDPDNSTHFSVQVKNQDTKSSRF